jgi:hypothetical protein
MQGSRQHATNNNGDQSGLVPTDTPRGSPERVRIYRERADSGLSLFHPQDSLDCVWRPLERMLDIDSVLEPKKRVDGPERKAMKAAWAREYRRRMAEQRRAVSGS